MESSGGLLSENLCCHGNGGHLVFFHENVTQGIKVDFSLYHRYILMTTTHIYLQIYWLSWLPSNPLPKFHLPRNWLFRKLKLSINVTTLKKSCLVTIRGYYLFHCKYNVVA